MAIGGTWGAERIGVCVDEGESLPGKLQPTAEPALILTSTRRNIARHVCLGRLETWFFFAFSCISGVAWPSGTHAVLKIARLYLQEAVLEPGTTAHDNWVSAGATVYRQFWIFDVKNPQEIVNDGATPVVEEKGPYTYK